MSVSNASPRKHLPAHRRVESSPFDASAFVGRTLTLQTGPTFEVLRINPGANTISLRMVPHVANPAEFYSPNTSGVSLPHHHAIEHIDIDTWWLWIASGAVVLETTTTQAETEQESKAYERRTAAAATHEPVKRFSVSGY